MQDPAIQQAKRRFLIAGLAILAVLLLGTTGYMLLTGPEVSAFDCLYMVVITITTIGYSEIMDLSHNPWGRVFTMVVAIVGIGVLGYIISSATAFIVEGQLSTSLRRRKMEKRAAAMKGHYIICGLGNVGSQILAELTATQRDVVVITSPETPEEDRAKVQAPLILADASDCETLASANVANAAGLFATTTDDNDNIVITLTARQANPNLRIVARSELSKNVPKLKAAGANAVILPSTIGALRMASEMVRPAVVSFLDMMLRDKELNLRVEEIAVPEAGRTISSLGLSAFPNTLLLALKTGDGWRYNPPADAVLGAGTTLIVMTTAEERTKIEQRLARGAG